MLSWSDVETVDLTGVLMRVTEAYYLNKVWKIPRSVTLFSCPPTSNLVKSSLTNRKNGKSCIW